MHLNCVGDGSPTVVLDAGLGGWSLDWALVQPVIASATRVCSYDRAGMGWSESSPIHVTPSMRSLSSMRFWPMVASPVPSFLLGIQTAACEPSCTPRPIPTT